MRTVYVNEGEAAMHEAAIDSLASEMRRPIDEIKPHYERELGRLQDGARVREFLSVCTIRHVRDALRQTRGGTQNPGH